MTHGIGKIDRPTRPKLNEHGQTDEKMETNVGWGCMGSMQPELD